MPVRLKQCTRCQQSFPATHEYFGVSGAASQRLKPYCYACGAIIAAERRARKVAKSLEWARANRHKVRESAKKTYARTRKARLAYYRRYRQENKEKLRESARDYAKRKREQMDAQS